jgi:hypothetical protein
MVEIKEKTIGIIGMKRAGKTYYTRKLTEGIGERCIIFDTIGALKIESAARYKCNPATLEKDAIAWGTLMLSTKKKSISVDLSNLTQDEIVEFTDISLKIANEGIRNKYIVVDEIAEFVPQLYRQSKEMQRLIRHGGNAGNTFIFNTQRPAYINKNTFNLIDILVVFRVVYPKDIEVIKEILSDTGKADLSKVISEIKQQRVGESKTFIF